MPGYVNVVEIISADALLTVSYLVDQQFALKWVQQHVRTYPPAFLVQEHSGCTPTITDQ